MPRYNVVYDLSFDFVLRFFALSTEDPDEIAKDLIGTIFGTTIQASLEQATGIGSGVVLSGQDVAGSNYEYVYKLNIPIGNVTDTDYGTISADTPAEALSKIRNTAARMIATPGMPVRLEYLQEI